MNFLFLLFCLACRVWHLSKINYVFVFEYDTRHHLDWRQLAEVSNDYTPLGHTLTSIASLLFLLPFRLFYVAELQSVWQWRRVYILPGHSNRDHCVDSLFPSASFLPP